MTQDTTCAKTVELLTNNILLQRQLIQNQEKEIDRLETSLLRLADSLNNEKKKTFVLASQNGVLKEKTNKREWGFKIGSGIVNLIILYLTSK